jgi:hypothetical protein
MDALKLREQLLLLAEQRRNEAIRERHQEAWLIKLAQSHALMDVCECIAKATVTEPCTPPTTTEDQ